MNLIIENIILFLSINYKLIVGVALVQSLGILIFYHILNFRISNHKYLNRAILLIYIIIWFSISVQSTTLLVNQAIKNDVSFIILYVGYVVGFVFIGTCLFLYLKHKKHIIKDTRYSDIKFTTKIINTYVVLALTLIFLGFYLYAKHQGIEFQARGSSLLYFYIISPIVMLLFCFPPFSKHRLNDFIKYIIFVFVAIVLGNFFINTTKETEASIDISLNSEDILVLIHLFLLLSVTVWKMLKVFIALVKKKVLDILFIGPDTIRALSFVNSSYIGFMKRTSLYRIITNISGLIFAFSIFIATALIILGNSTVPVFLFQMGTSAAIIWLINLGLRYYMTNKFVMYSSLNKSEECNRQITLIYLFAFPYAIFSILVLLVYILYSMNISFTAIASISGILTILAAVGAQSILRDFFKAVTIIVSDSISLNNWIEAGGVDGSVEEMAITYLRLRDLQGRLHTIPYSNIDIITNYSREYAYAFVEIAVSRDEDYSEVVELITKAAEDFVNTTTEDIKSYILGPLEVFGISNVTDHSMVIRTRIKAIGGYQYSVRYQFLFFIQEELRKAGIKQPDYSLNLKNNN